MEISAAEDAGFGLGVDILASESDDILGATVRHAVDGVETLEKAPVIGQAMSGLQCGYHLGSSLYDAFTGDRDGAFAHGAQALANGAMVVPGVNAALGDFDSALGYFGTGTRFATDALGAPEDVVDSIPTGVDDMAASAAVFLSNAVFGAEDKTNNTGTRGGEISAGLRGLDFIASGPMALANYGISAATGMDPGTQIAEMFGVAGDATSGTEPTLAAKAGASVHDSAASWFDGMF